MKSLLCTLAVLAIGTISAMRTEDGGNVPSCKGTANTIPVNTDSPSFVKEFKNAKVYQAGKGNDTFQIIHVWGTPYEQGFANGKQNAAALQAMWPKFLKFIDDLIENKSHDIVPMWLLDLFDKYGVAPLLQWSFEQTKPFTPQKYLDEMQGLADGANVSVAMVHHMNMFPEQTRAACTIVGATRSATPDGKIAHLRGLDFSPHMPIKDHPQVTVYHTEGQPTVANVGWATLIGSLTGISDRTIAIGEKVWLHEKKVDGWHGEPWMFILRDVLLTKNITNALDTMQNANRTCAIHVGVGDSTTNTFRGVTMAKHAFDVYNSSSLDWPGHPVIEDVMYWNKHSQPSHDPCLGHLLTEYYGQLTAKSLALQVAPVTATGDMHCVTFDYGNQMAYIANARKTFVEHNKADWSLPAYNRQFTLVNLTKLWMETAPTI